MPFLTLTGYGPIKVAAYEPTYIKAQDEARAIDNSLRWAVAGTVKLEAQVTAGPMPKAEADALITFLLTNGSIPASGDELGGTRTMKPDITGIAVIDERRTLTWAKSVTFTLKEL